jgi:predicted transcriptional regulator
MNEKQPNEIASQLEGIKRLLIMMLIDKGFKQQQIAQTLGVSQPTISRMFPKGTLDKGKAKSEVRQNDRD